MECNLSDLLRDEEKLKVALIADKEMDKCNVARVKKLNGGMLIILFEKMSKKNSQVSWQDYGLRSKVSL